MELFQDNVRVITSGCDYLSLELTRLQAVSKVRVHGHVTALQRTIFRRCVRVFVHVIACRDWSHDRFLLSCGDHVTCL